VQADGHWHRAELDLLGLAERTFGPDAKLVASDLFIGNMSTKDYLDAGFGGNLPALRCSSTISGCSSPRETRCRWR
jgi:hypothetical protein